MHARYLVLQVSTWIAFPNHAALIRMYANEPDMIWFGPALNGEDHRSKRPYPTHATILADYGEIDDHDNAGQEEAIISAIRSFYPSVVKLVAAEGWIDPSGQFYACHDGETHEERALRIAVTRFQRIAGGELLEWREWIHVTAMTDLADRALTDGQRDTPADLSTLGDQSWQAFMARVLATLDPDAEDADARW